ncbi:Asparagine synthetase [glutamine-hydrolyzing] [hydrothermal vent metagenome]|uniref:Asparagine synthetase [glutamine-hydrolyzing] n=1 Tax=hydrothermal vent metagenome TaxID=652676 RepID=A0A3B0YF03_9ZZZZ
MCGICGEFRFDGKVPDTGVVTRMLSRLERRGPDHEGRYLKGPVSLGHRRLSVIDLSDASNQPWVDETRGLALVFNGAIYNYRELRAELIDAGVAFVSDGDTEVVLKAYAHWGEAFVSRLHGMFALAIWDDRRQQLLAARDRFGIKPFYYRHTRNSFRFASNTQALLSAGGVDTRFDSVALHHHFTLHAVVPAPRTLLRGIRKLPPAHLMVIDAQGKERLSAYWQLDASPPDKPLSEDEWLEATRSALLEAVRRRRVIADVPVGVLLSGGLDSSLLVALLAREGGNDLLTFSVGFEDHADERGNEFEFSDAVAERYGTQHHKIHVPNHEVLDRLPEAIDQMAEPMVGQDAVAFYLLSEKVSQHVKVVQSGQGADEVFAGYFWYPRMHAARGSDIERFQPFYFDRDHQEYLQMVTPKYAGPDYTEALVAERLKAVNTNEYLNKVLHFDVTTLVVDDPVKRVDNMTMAWGLEARVPFLDQQLVELVARMPPELKLRDDGKYPLKQIARGLIPDAVIDRPKAYFPVPALKYVSGPFLDFMRDILTSRACRERGLYRESYVQLLLENPEQQFTRLQGSKLWHLAALEFWLQRNVDAAG